MRVRLLLVPAVVLAIVAATGNSCAGSEHFTGTGPDVGGGANPGNTPQPDGGDSGIPPIVDGGNPCNTQVLPVGPLFTSDNCIQAPGTTLTTATISADAGCANVRIDLTDGFSCVGSLAGPTNAFTGNCGGPNPCTSSALPGTLNCTIQLNSAVCTIQVCANGAGTICP